jgi:nucleotide-binding universal stress UspA family protein
VNPLFDRHPVEHDFGILGNADRGPLRFLVGLDEWATLPDLVSYVGSAGAHGRVVARVVHVVELIGFPTGFSLESVGEASALVEEGTFLMRMSGVGAEGVVRNARVDRIARVLLEEGLAWHADAIVLGARRSSGARRLLGRGVREQVLRRSSMTTVLVSPQSLRSKNRLRGGRRAHRAKR